MKNSIEVIKALKDNFIYALINGRECAVIDPGEAAPVSEFLKRNGLRLSHILCTHHHPDHVGGIPELQKVAGAEVWCSPTDFKRIAGATKAVAGRESLWGMSVEILDLPGHTLGQIAFYIPALKAVFPGDTLFSAGCGRLFEGTPEQMFESMRRLRALPAETEVFFGHEYTLRNLDFVEKYAAAPASEIAAYREACRKKLLAGAPTTPSRIATELKVNPFLNAADVAQFTKWRELRNSW